MPFQGGRRRTVMVVMVMMTMVMMMVSLGKIWMMFRYNSSILVDVAGRHVDCWMKASTAGTVPEVKIWEPLMLNVGPQQFKSDWLYRYIYIITGWWFGTCCIFPYIGNHNPNCRGVETTNQIYVHIYIYISLSLITKALYQKHATSLRNRLRLLRRGSQPAIYWWIEDIYQLYRYIDYLILPVKIAI